jgi:hypothetical protein
MDVVYCCIRVELGILYGADTRHTRHARTLLRKSTNPKHSTYYFYLDTSLLPTTFVSSCYSFEKGKTCFYEDFFVCVCRSLCAKFPRKHGVLMNFLASMLRDEVRASFTLVALDV